MSILSQAAACFSALLLATGVQASDVTINIFVGGDRETVVTPSVTDLADKPTFKDTAEVSKRLGISEERARAIIVGEPARANVLGFAIGTSAEADDEFECNDFNCTCYGDDACNNMFSTVCANPATNGSCVNGDDPDGVVCGCNPNFPPSD